MAISKNPVVTCDNCEEEFKLKQNRIRIETIEEEIERTYFKCPNCKHKFIIMFKDKEVKENLKEMDKIKLKIQESLKNKKDVGNFIDKYEKLYYRNLEISDKYKSLYDK
ncbi:hypothetical protein ACYIU4_002822 [Clostridium botulinum]